MNATPNPTTIEARDQQANDEICKRIRISLSAKRPELGRIEVRVDGGTVYLSGRLPSFHARQLAVTVARHVPGVHQIVDEIHVGPGSKSLLWE